MNNTEELIQLSSAHVTQQSIGGEKSEWAIEENITNNRLGTLPRHLSEVDVFAILNLARKYELKAFNSGIDFQKDKNNGYLNDKIKHLMGLNKELSAENERLSEVLDKQQQKG